MKQTAVEWFAKELNNWRIKEFGEDSIIGIPSEVFEQAKEMEKEQSECICVNVIEMILNESEQGKEINSKEIFEQCYNETFKSE
jgi:hypothetical protein